MAVKAIADAALHDIKAGRVLSAKNEESLRTAYDAIGKVLETLGSTEEDQDKARLKSAKDRKNKQQQPLRPRLRSASNQSRKTMATTRNLISLSTPSMSPYRSPNGSTAKVLSEMYV